MAVDQQARGGVFCAQRNGASARRRPTRSVTVLRRRPVVLGGGIPLPVSDGPRAQRQLADGRQRRVGSHGGVGAAASHSAAAGPGADAGRAADAGASPADVDARARTWSLETSQIQPGDGREYLTAGTRPAAVVDERG